MSTILMIKPDFTPVHMTHIFWDIASKWKCVCKIKIVKISMTFFFKNKMIGQ